MKKKIVGIIFLFIIGVSLFLKIELTNLLSELIKREIKEITDLDIQIEAVYLRILPLNFEIKNLKYADTESNSININKIKLYLSIHNILKREINIRRIFIQNAEITSSYDFVVNCKTNIENYLKKSTSPPLIIKINSFEIENLSAKISRHSYSLSLESIRMRALLKSEPEFKVLSQIKLKTSELPNFASNLKADFKIKDKRVILNELKFFDIQSLLKTDGFFDYNKFFGEFLVTGKIFLDSIKSFFGMRDGGKGEINLNGKVFVVDSKDFLNMFKFDIDFDGEFYIEELMKILKVSEKIEGFTAISKGKLQGSLSNIEIKAQAKQIKGNILGISTDRVLTEVHYYRGILEFKNGKIELYGGKANAYVWINLPVVTKHYVFVEVNKLSSSGVFDLIEWNPEIAEGVVSGWLESKGSVFAPKGYFTYTRKDQLPVDVRGRIDQISGLFESDGQRYTFSNLILKSQGTKINAEGTVDTKEKLLNLRFEGLTNNIKELTEPYESSFSGEALIFGNLTGKFENPEIELRFKANQVALNLNQYLKFYNNQSFTINEIEGHIRYRKNKLQILSLSDKANIRINGEINFPEAKNLFELSNPQFDINFSIKNLPIRELYVKAIENYVYCMLNFSGFIKEKNRVGGELRIFDVFVGKEKVIDSINALVDYQEGNLSIKKSNIVRNADKIQSEGIIYSNGNINFTGFAKQINIYDLTRKYLEKIGARNIQTLILKNLNFQIAGNLKEPKINSKSDLFIKSTSNKTIDGRINMNFLDNKLIISSTILKNGKLELIRSINDEWSLKAIFNSTRIDPLVSLFTNKLPEDFLLLIDGEISSNLINKKINASINLKRLFTRLYGIGLNNKSPIMVNLRENNVFIEPISMIGQSTEINFKGKITDYYDILIDGYTDLRPLKALFNIDNIKGRANILVYIYENRNNPEIVGEVNLENCSLTLRKDIPNFNDINATITFNENRVIVEKAEGKFSEGNIRIGGIVSLKDLDIYSFALKFDFNDVRWIFSPFSWAYLNGEVHLNGKKNSPKLIGTIELTKGVYTENIDLIKLAIRADKTKTVLSKEDWLSNIDLNLKIQTNNFILSNNLAEIKIGGDLLVKSKLSAPSLLGWIYSNDGFIYFRNNKFQLQRLSLQFTDPERIRPLINLTARTNISQYNINLNLNGYLDQFNLILSSNPPLSENELLNLLVIGQQNGAKTGASIGASEVTNLITGQIQGLVEERIRGITGLDLMTVEPAISRTTGSMVPRVTIGKRLMDGKLNVTYSTSTGTTAEQIIKVEYNISKGISLVGLRDESGGISGAVKFRFHFH